MATRSLSPFGKITEEPPGLADQAVLSRRYRQLRRNMIIIMVVVTILPLSLMTVINHYVYTRVLKDEIIVPMQGLASKTKHSFELFLTERLSALSFVASAYSYGELTDQGKLRLIFRVMREEFGGFVDLGVIEPSGVQASYVGPYQLKDKQYSDHDWFQEVVVRGEHISDVFMGYRKFPHLVIAVKHDRPEDDQSFYLRATIDTERFDNLIAAMALDPSADAFILNRSGVFQTSSRLYGDVLDSFPMPMPPLTYDTNVLEMVDPDGCPILMAYTYFESSSHVLGLIKPRSDALESWYSLQNHTLFLFITSAIVIFIAVFVVTSKLVKRIEQSDRERRESYHEVEHRDKLASIGRLAAGVAHEVNNPMAIIGEKAGLMEDLIGTMDGFEGKERFLELTDSIQKSVERCSTITHRLLGFARRMDVEIISVDVNEILMEVHGFLEREAMHRNVDVQLDLADDIPEIQSDHGQLQQVFLNILNNALSAVEDGGLIEIITWWQPDPDMVGTTIRDNGVGMSEETRDSIFEPFFSDQKGYGTGLGLSITHGIVKKLGGNIEVQSKEGEGTAFTVFLPCKA